MSHASPAAYLVWTLLTAILGIFLAFHLWCFDRFKCLKWNSGASSGAFKRIMTYSYLISLPLIFIYAAGNAIIKYHEGFIQLPFFGIVPKPYQFWEPSAQRTIFPLMLCFSVGWSLEMVTHLEELCFWLFLVNSGSSQQNWFHSLYFKTWVTGSCIAVVYMPLITILTRGDHLKSEAFTFLAGSLGSLSLTLWFTPILWTFPTFLNNLRVEGVDSSTIIRLTKFAELNMIRVVFRFLFTVPLLILGVDGVRPHNHINESMLWVDFLTFIAGFGCVISSGITLVIFFPRSIEGEIAAKDAAREQRKRNRSYVGTANSMGELDSVGTRSVHGQNSGYHDQSPPSPSVGGTYLLTSSPVKKTYGLPSYDSHRDDVYDLDTRIVKSNAWDEEERDVAAALPPIRPLRKSRTRDAEANDGLTESNLSAHTIRVGNVNPMVSNFTSPIDFAYASEGKPRNESRLTFTRR